MSQLGAIFWVRTLHAPSRERPLAPFVPNSQFHRMRSSGAQVAQSETRPVMEMFGAEKRTPRADGMEIEDAHTVGNEGTMRVPQVHQEFQMLIFATSTNEPHPPCEPALFLRAPLPCGRQAPRSRR